MSEDKKPKKRDRKKAADSVPVHAPYTDVITGVPGASLIIHGFRSRTDAASIARKHFEMAAARAHAALEALEANKFSIRYRNNMDVVDGNGDSAKAG